MLHSASLCTMLTSLRCGGESLAMTSDGFQGAPASANEQPPQSPRRALRTSGGNADMAAGTAGSAAPAKVAKNRPRVMKYFMMPNSLITPIFSAFSPRPTALLWIFTPTVNHKRRYRRKRSLRSPGRLPSQTRCQPFPGGASSARELPCVSSQRHCRPPDSSGVKRRRSK